MIVANRGRVNTPPYGKQTDYKMWILIEHIIIGIMGIGKWDSLCPILVRFSARVLKIEKSGHCLHKILPSARYLRHASGMDIDRT